MKQFWLLIVVLVLGSCASSEISEAIRTEVEANRTVDLSAVAPGAWERVCVLGPYSDDQFVSETLGFRWPAEARSSIEESDGISLLLFVNASDVVHAVEHPRDAGDFSNLSGRCFPREQAKFDHHAKQSQDDWPWLVPRDGA